MSDVPDGRERIGCPTMGLSIVNQIWQDVHIYNSNGGDMSLHKMIRLSDIGKGIEMFQLFWVLNVSEV